MAELPPIRKLYIEDYASQKSWIGPFLITLNTFITTVVSALTKEITLVDNTTSDIKTITLAAVPTSDNPASVSWTKNQRPIAVIVGNIQFSDNSVITLTNPVQIQWQMSSSGSSLQLINLIGITPTQAIQYTLTLVCIAG